jgi:hypothetical protein
MLTRRHPLRASAALGVATALLLASLAVPTLAKLANVTVTATAVPGSVTPGANVAIDLRFYNSPSTSNISQLYLNATTPAGWTLVEIESKNQGACTAPAGGDVYCNIGAVNAGADFDARIVYTTPSGGSGSVALDWFLFNTTGVANDTGKRSHGDNYIPTGSVTLDTSNDFGGAYTSTGTQLVTDNTTLSKRQNPQYTQVNAPEGGIGITVGEATFPCPAEIGKCFGQWSVISVNDGALYSPDGFSVVLGYVGNIGNVKFVHVLDDGTVQKLDACTANPAPVTERNPGCYWIDASGSNTLVTIWLVENGRLSGY